MNNQTLASVLGAGFWVARFPTADAATRHACDRMAQGRPAVTFTSEDGAYCAAWGTAS